ncbi:hypothetical protein BAUCODRAFT_30297 [Baudoinia panamericana UAMH 10762]|uniref:Uncharacterized protein n=1 Tax=Baudoinia panamericana (strain UAMH 10762) TaxID=717646 RepID=M2MSN0_BAUPA|nr:uncharacterized protein BAUCODRAFT_30297 [Baudoinia panamericana UAMH 10762]EMC99886.1 hypothetical protein BAUCODRAFT_30297 [Baudoinia panamericana UAMH 10762]
MYVEPGLTVPAPVRAGDCGFNRRGAFDELVDAGRSCSANRPLEDVRDGGCLRSWLRNAYLICGAWRDMWQFLR